MRTLSRSLLATAFALVLAGQANAIAVTLTQTGGTYAGSATASDTLLLRIDLVIEAGDVGNLLNLADAGIVAVGGADALAVGSTETSFVAGPPFGGFIAPIVGTADITQVSPVTATNPGGVTAQFDGWELASAGGVAMVGTGTVTMGTIALHLDGTSGTITLGGFGNNFGSVFSQNGGVIFSPSSLGTFTIVGSSVPEPTTAGLMTLGLVGLAFAGRRR